MADYHYTPDTQGRSAQIIGALRDLDCELLPTLRGRGKLIQVSDDAILEYSVPQIDEVFQEEIIPDGDDEMNGNGQQREKRYRSLLDLQSMPVFSDRRLPLLWKWVLPSHSLCLSLLVDLSLGLAGWNEENMAI